MASRPTKKFGYDYWVKQQKLKAVHGVAQLSDVEGGGGQIVCHCPLPSKDDLEQTSKQGASKRCPPLQTNSALAYEPKCEGRGGAAGSQLPMNTAVHRSPN